MHSPHELILPIWLSAGWGSWAAVSCNRLCPV